MNRKTIAIIVGVVLALCIFVCVALGLFTAVTGGGIAAIFSATQPVADAGEKFMQTLKAADYNAAYKLCDPSLQKQLGSATGLKNMIERGKAQPVKWTFDSRNIENNTGKIEGRVTMAGGEGTLTLEFAKAGKDWLVTGFDMSAD